MRIDRPTAFICNFSFEKQSYSEALNPVEWRFFGPSHISKEMSPDGRPTDGVMSRSHQPARHLLPPGLHFPGAGRLKNWPVPANDESSTRTVLLSFYFYKNFSFKRIFLRKLNLIFNLKILIISSTPWVPFGSS